MGYDIQAEREEKERQAKRTAARQARIDRMKKGKLALLYADTKVFLLDLFEKLQEYREERKLSKCKITDLVFCFFGFIFFSVIFGNMLSFFDRKTVLPPAPANNTAALPAKPAISALPPVTTNQNQFQEVRQEKEATKKWYEGGNLRHADLATWKKASYENKLATAADWAFVTSLVKRVFYQSRNIDTVKPFAMELVECIDKATDGIDTTDKTYEIAAICSVSMGWQE